MSSGMAAASIVLGQSAFVDSVPPERPVCLHAYGVQKPISAAGTANGWGFAGLHTGILMGRRADPVGAEEESRVEVAAHTAVIRMLAAFSEPPFPPATLMASSESTSMLDGGVTVLTCSADGEAKRYQFPASGDGWQMTYKGHEGSVECFAVGPPGANRLFTGGADGTVREWVGSSGECCRVVRCHAGRVTTLIIPFVPPSTDPEAPEVTDAPGPGFVLTGSDDGLGKYIDLNTKSVLSLYGNDGSPVTSGAYIHPEVYFGSADGKIRGFHLHTARKTRELAGHTDSVSALVSIEGRLFSASDDKSVILWNLAAWTPLRRFEGHSQCVSALSTNQHGELISGSYDGVLRLWDREGVVRRLEAEDRQAAAEAAEKKRTEQREAKEAEARALAKASKKNQKAAATRR